MFDVSIFSALLGGILTFLAPCTLPLIPAYIGFLGGAGNGGLEARSLKRHIIFNACFFVLGFSLVFIFFGLISGAVGKFLFLHRMLFSRVSGVLVILFGLSLLNILPLPHFLVKFFVGRKFPSWLSPGKSSSAFLLGLLFALGWSPCLGPILGAILTLAASSATAWHGAFLLSIYALGLAIPFLLVAILYGSTFTYVSNMARYLPLISRITALLLIGIGFLLLLGQFGLLNVWALRIFHGQWEQNFVQYM